MVRRLALFVLSVALAGLATVARTIPPVLAVTDAGAPLPGGELHRDADGAARG